MKRFFSICLVVALTLGFVACEEPQTDEPNKEQTGGENNGGNEQNTPSIVGEWKCVISTNDNIRTQIYKFHEDLTGTFESTMLPLVEGAPSETNATWFQSQITYEFDFAAQSLIINESVPGLPMPKVHTFTAKLSSDQLLLTLTATTATYPNPDMNVELTFDRTTPSEEGAE